MLKRPLMALLLTLSFSNTASALTLRDFLDVLQPKARRPNAPSSFTATATSSTTADLTWKSAGAGVGGYILLTFHEVSSKNLRLPKNCRFYLGSDRNVRNHDDDDEGEDEDHRRFPRVDSTALGMVSSYRVTGLKPLEMVMFRLCAVSASRPKRVSSGAEAFLTMPAATSIQIAAISDVLTNVPKQVSAAITSNATYSTKWSQTSGPGHLTFAPSNGSTTKISADVDGVYQVTVTASTISGIKASTSFKFTWATAKPIVTLASTIYTNKPVVITASVMSALATTYQWSATPAVGITFSDAKALMPTITAASNGTFVLRLVATDLAGNMGSASTNVTWSTTPPVVSTRQTIYTNLSSVRLMATAIGLGPLNYQWQSVGGLTPLTFVNGNSLSPTVFVPSDGIFTARLFVKDMAGNVSSTDVTIAKDGTPPVVSAGNDILAAAPVTLHGSVVDANAVTLLWTKISGPGTIAFSSNSSLTTAVTASSAGTYELQLSATDSFGNIGSDKVIYIFDNVPPTSAITSSLSSPTSTSPIPIDITFSKPVTGFTKAALAVTGASITGFTGSGANYQASLTPVAASVTARVSAGLAQDQAGNINLASPLFTIAYNKPNGNPGGSGGGGISTTVVFKEEDFQNCLKSNLPSAPALAAPADGTLISFFDKIRFLLPNQSGLTTLLDPVRTGMIRGRVMNFDGTPVIGAVVSLPDYPGFGSTTTTACGDYYLAANGGLGYAVAFSKPGLIASQRRVDVPMGDFVWVDDLIMRPLDTKKTVLTVGGGGNGVSVAQSSVIVDADGPRQVTMLVPSRTVVTVKNADGSIAKRGLSTITVSANELTIGPNGPLAMPGRLPPNTKYTYAVDLKIDEAAEGQRVEFSQPLYTYVDNFLNFPVGTVVPSGYYDEAAHYWKGSDDGIVVKILTITNGKAVLSVTPDQAPATADHQTWLGVTSSELTTLASTFAVGQEFWRIPIRHFTPYDFNFSYGTPLTATNKPNGCNQGGPGCDPVPAVGPCTEACCLAGGGNGNGASGGNSNSGGGNGGNGPGTGPFGQASHSIIDVPKRSLNEAIPVAGTNFYLSYQSDRVPGYIKSYEIDIPVGSLHADSKNETGQFIDSNVVKVDVQVDIEGKRYRTTIDGAPATSDVYPFIWDGLDQFGRKVLGGSRAEITVTHHINPQSYLIQVSQFLTELVSWAKPGGTDSGLVRKAAPTTVVGKWSALLGAVSAIDPSRSKIGGWFFSPQHFKDVANNIIYLGDGSVRRGRIDNLVLTKLFGFAQAPNTAVDYKYPVTLGTYTASGITVGPDDSIYTIVRGASGNHLVKFLPDGNQSIVAGNGDSSSYGADHVLATSTSIGQCSTTTALVRVSGDGTVYFIECALTSYESVLIRKIDPTTGMVTTVAGRGPQINDDPSKVNVRSGDNGLATDALILPHVNGLAVDDVGNVYFTTDTTIRKISPTGILSTIAGLGTFDGSEDNGDGSPAINAPMQPIGLAVAKDGSIYVADKQFGLIRRITTDGLIDAFAGQYPHQTSCKYPIGGPVDADDICSIFPGDVNIAKDGTVYFFDGVVIRGVVAGNSVVNYVGSFGANITQSYTTLLPNLSSSRSALLINSTFGIDSKGNVVFDDQQSIWRTQLALGDVSSDGTEIYVFDQSGIHQRTLDSVTGKAIYTFGYNQGLLSSVTDLNGLATTIERDSSGNAKAIVAPYGQRTELVTDSSGYLASATQPNQAVIAMTYQTNALGVETGTLATFRDANGQVSHYTYDNLGQIASAVDPVGASSLVAEHPELSFDPHGPYEAVQVFTSALGRNTQYNTNTHENGFVYTQASYPNGTFTNYSSTEGRTSVQTPTLIQLYQYSDDPLFGAYSRYASSVTIDPYYGANAPHYQMTRSKTAVLTDPLDPLSATLLTDAVQLDGDQAKTFLTTTDRVHRTVTSLSPAGYKSVVTYDADGRVVKKQDPGVYPLFLAYDANGRVIQASQGANCDQAPNATCRTTSFNYAPLGQPGAGNVASITDATGNTTSLIRDSLGRVTSTTYAGTTTRVAYDNLDHVTAVLPPGHSAQNEHSFAFSPVGQLASYDPPAVVGLSQASTKLSYDLDRSLTQLLLPDVSGTALPISYGYDPVTGQLVSETRPEGTVTYGYDSLHQYLQSIAGPGPITLNVVNAGPLLQSAQFSNVPTIGVSPMARWTYNNQFQVSSASLDGGATFAYTYDNDGILQQVGGLSLSRGSNGQYASAALGSLGTSWSYDSYGALASMSTSSGGSAINGVTLHHDNLGRIVSRIETVGTDAANQGTFQYDSVGRIASVFDGVKTTSYTYDMNGNRLNNGATYDDQDRLISDNVYNYAYDGRGALRQKVSRLNGDVTNYQYDVFGRLMSATLPGGKNVSYQLDGLGRRVARQANGGAWTGMIYQDGTHLIGMVDASGNVTAQYVYATSGSSPDYMIKNGVSYRIISDERGSVRLVVNATDGTVAQRMDYDVWGNVTADTAPGFQPFGFAGGIYDSVTGLVRFGARDYDASMGRWVSKDPLLFGGGQSNLYVYSGNDPMNRIDPSGTLTAGIGFGGSFTVGGFSFGADGQVVVDDRGNIGVATTVCFGGTTQTAAVSFGVLASGNTANSISDLNGQSGTLGGSLSTVGPLSLTGGLSASVGSDSCGKPTFGGQAFAGVSAGKYPADFSTMRCTTTVTKIGGHFK